jgi:hypothetical protein
MMGDIAPRSNGGIKGIASISNTANVNILSQPINSVVAGPGAISKGPSSVVIGANARSTGTNVGDFGGGVVIGRNCSSNGYGAVIGTDSSLNSAGNWGIIIGKACTSTNANNIALGYNISAAGNTVVAIGSQNSVSVNYGISIGGASNAVSGLASICVNAGGTSQAQSIFINATTWGNAVGEYPGQIGLNTGYWPSAGGAGLSGYLVGVSFVTLMTETTTATTTELGTPANGTAAPTTRIALLADSTYCFNCDIVARDTASDTTSSVWNMQFAMRRGAAAANTTLMASAITTVIAQDASAAGWTIGVTADTTNGRPNIAVTGEAGKTIRWIATCKVTRVSG